ncbi:hypothetical protein PENANT_c002G09137 [Penicillium antarcticum]|uniref:Zn(2)-C6 fungal-type domain-containing protein n=1 Tax=Penicillium antarcticum TaxID=416450 RepID=A0A1V6QLA6_9EURO|nr:hypothetical protein PENANT_c002G09137 [Penicillium antarcticum]
MTRSKNIRLYRACQRCRTRKLKCDPISSPDGTRSQCFECIRSNEPCIPAGSKRGGNFSQFRRPKRVESLTPTPSPVNPNCQNASESMEENAKRVEDPIYAELTNPGEALQILARLAAHDQSMSTRSSDQIPAASAGEVQARNDNYDINLPGPVTRPLLRPTLSETETLVIGVLGTDTTQHLLIDYATNYHPFCPLTPRRLLVTPDVHKTAIDEPFLLTVILTIASKDDTAYREIHQHCWQHIKRYLLDILLATPSTLNVATVEGLLLLAEWIPYSDVGISSNPRLLSGNLSAVEDNMAWSLIGQAVRHAYLLRLDKASFREKVDGEPYELENRKRLAWIFVYIADRQISVRMGQSFWSRGPSLSTRFTAKDFPSLQLSVDSEHNYALVLQATIELTQLLHNAHDILYSSKERRLQMVRLGDYNRYLDDFRRSFSGWQSRWDGLEASPKLKCTLTIFKEAVHDNRVAGTSASWHKRAPSLFPEGIMASPDGVYVFEAVRSARNILTIACGTDPVAHIRYMPFRFYVYAIYSAVFLYKAGVFGAFTHREHGEVSDLVHQFISILDEASTGDSHIGGRYAKLLKRICFVEQNRRAITGNNPPYISTRNDKPSNLDSLGSWDSYIPPDMSCTDAILMPSPDFNLFCPDFSTLESELFDPMAGG